MTVTTAACDARDRSSHHWVCVALPCPRHPFGPHASHEACDLGWCGASWRRGRPAPPCSWRWASGRIKAQGVSVVAWIAGGRRLVGGLGAPAKAGFSVSCFAAPRTGGRRLIAGLLAGDRQPALASSRPPPGPSAWTAAPRLRSSQQAVTEAGAQKPPAALRDTGVPEKGRRRGLTTGCGLWSRARGAVRGSGGQLWCRTHQKTRDPLPGSLTNFSLVE